MIDALRYILRGWVLTGSVFLVHWSDAQTHTVAMEGPKCYYYRWSHRVGSMDVARGPLTELRCRIAVAEKRQAGHIIEKDCNCSPEDRARALNRSPVASTTSAAASSTISTDCSSREANLAQLRASSECFAGANTAVVQDLHEMLSSLDCGVYLDKVICSGSEIHLSWFARDSNGAQVNVPSDRRASINELYAELKARSKDRRMEEVERQMEQAQRREDVEALINEINRLAEDIKSIREEQRRSTGSVPDPWSERELDQLEPSISGQQTSNGSAASNTPTSEGGDRVIMDTDGDGVDDMEAVRGVDGGITYRDIQAVQAMHEVQKATDVNAMIADALEKEVKGSERSATMATWRGGSDGDADGYIESLRLGLPNDWHLIATDSDHDGKVDQVQYFDGQGVQREPAPSGVDLGGVSDPRDGSGQLNQFLNLANQRADLGEDGHVTHLTAPNGSDVMEKGPKIYSFNGVATTNEKAISTGNDIRLMHETPVEVIYNQTDGLPQDLVESLRTKSGNFSNTFTQVVSRRIANDLANGEQVRVFAHSEGAALTEASIYPIKAELQQRGMSDRLRNLTIVTLGGYSDKAENWPSGVNVIAVNNNDIVPLFGGNAHGSFDPTNTQGSVSPTLANHSLTNYYPWIRMFANPATDLTPLYGGSFSAKDWNWISTAIGP